MDTHSIESLPINDPEIVRKMTLDLQAQRTGVVETKYDGVDSLLVYGSIDEFGTALLLIVPKVDFVAEAVAMEKTVHERVEANIQITGIILIRHNCTGYRPRLRAGQVDDDEHSETGRGHTQSCRRGFQQPGPRSALEMRWGNWAEHSIRWCPPWMSGSV